METDIQVVPRVIGFKCAYNSGVGKCIGVLHIPYLEHLFEAMASLVATQLYLDLVLGYKAIVPGQFSKSVI